MRITVYLKYCDILPRAFWHFPPLSGIQEYDIKHFQYFDKFRSTLFRSVNDKCYSVIQQGYRTPSAVQFWFALNRCVCSCACRLGQQYWFLCHLCKRRCSGYASHWQMFTGMPAGRALSTQASQGLDISLFPWGQIAWQRVSLNQGHFELESPWLSFILSTRPVIYEWTLWCIYSWQF